MPSNPFDMWILCAMKHLLSIQRNRLLKLGLLCSDAALVGVALYLSYLIRFDFSIWPYYSVQLVRFLPTVIAIRLSLFYHLGVYRFLWRYSSLTDLVTIAKSVGMGTLLILGIDAFRNYYISMLFAASILLSALLRRLAHNLVPSRSVSKTIMLGIWLGAVVTLVTAWLAFTQLASAPISLAEVPGLQLGLFNEASYELGVPRAILLLEGIMSFLLIGGMRLCPRLWSEWRSTLSSKGRPVLILGAGDLGENVLRAIRQEGNKYRLVGFIDDDPAKQQSSIHGVRVLGTSRNLLEIASVRGVEELLVAVSDVSGEMLQELVTKCSPMGIKIRHLPGLASYLSGRIRVTDFRDIDITDLLGRPEVHMDSIQIAVCLRQRVVLVTGAGGSIGSEICRQVAEFGPTKLILFGKGESSIDRIFQELSNSFPKLDIVSVIGDIRHREKVDHVFARFRPAVVFHAAAHKYVPLMEQDPDEAVSANVFGTRNIAEASGHCQVERFVLISSDKAVKPSSVMGATKRLAELQVQQLAKRSGNCRFVTVRFGNVLGSRGSVALLFERQIAEGGPVTVTHPKMTRFFMSIPEAVRLVLHSVAIGGNGDLCILDMGKPVRILDLAENMIRAAGLKPHEDMPIIFTGIRPGEKLEEELMTEDQVQQVRKIGQIMICKPQPFDWDALAPILSELEQAAAKCEQAHIFELLRRAVPDYQPDAYSVSFAREHTFPK